MYRNRPYLKNKNRKNFRINEKSVSEHCSSYVGQYFYTILRIFYDHISKTKSQEIDLSFGSEHGVTFWRKKKSGLLEGGGVSACRSLGNTQKNNGSKNDLKLQKIGTFFLPFE